MMAKTFIIKPNWTKKKPFSKSEVFYFCFVLIFGLFVLFQFFFLGGGVCEKCSICFYEVSKYHI